MVGSNTEPKTLEELASWVRTMVVEWVNSGHDLENLLELWRISGS
jgi:hypothetical protein